MLVWFESYDDLQEALGEAPDVAFICNPSSLHISTAIHSAKAGCHLFIEKPLATEINNLELLEELLEIRGQYPGLLKKT